MFLGKYLERYIYVSLEESSTVCSAMPSEYSRLGHGVASLTMHLSFPQEQSLILLTLLLSHWCPEEGIYTVKEVTIASSFRCPPLSPQLGMVLQRLTQITPDGYLPVLRDMRTEYASHKWWNFRQL